MTPIRLCCIRTCNDPAEDKPNEVGEFLCTDHMQDWIEAKVLFDDTDEHGRSKSVLKNARAM
jgi:hypothetical protein